MNSPLPVRVAVRDRPSHVVLTSELCLIDALDSTSRSAGPVQHGVVHSRDDHGVWHRVTRILRRGLALFRRETTWMTGPEPPDHGRVHRLSESRINRSGLPTGVPAPPFELPDLDGRIRSLSEFRGSRVLLVFTAPDCVPCDRLAADLISLSKTSSRLEIVAITRGDVDENRRKAAELGLTFPVLLQPGWQVSKCYARFGTPVAYVIDDRGVLASRAAVGLDRIRALLEREADA
jgi:peroxiredoxin